MHKFIKNIFLTLLKLILASLAVNFMFSRYGFAQPLDQTPPVDFAEQCTAAGYKLYDQQLILNADNQITSRLFFIRNISSGTLMLNHANKNNPGLSAGFSSRLDQKAFSVLAINQANFPLSCAIYAPSLLGKIDCQTALSVCMIIPKHALGSFWVSENKSLLETMKTLKQRDLID